MSTAEDGIGKKKQEQTSVEGIRYPLQQQFISFLHVANKRWKQSVQLTMSTPWHNMVCIFLLVSFTYRTLWFTSSSCIFFSSLVHNYPPLILYKFLDPLLENSSLPSVTRFAEYFYARTRQTICWVPGKQHYTKSSFSSELRLSDVCRRWHSTKALPSVLSALLSVPGTRQRRRFR